MSVQLEHCRRADLRSVLNDFTAEAYNSAGRNYATYADGDAGRLFGFDGAYGYADREIWQRIDAKLLQLQALGRRTLNLLDAGCGPGTWLRRVVLRARELGFDTIMAHGLDISPAMVALARTRVTDLADPTIHVSIARADIRNRMPFDRGTFDISLCLYGVLNHVPGEDRDQVAAEFSRVTRDTVFVTVRTEGSLPTIYVDGIDRARSFHQDSASDWMDVELLDGRHLGFPSHLFTSVELRALFEPHLATTAVVGLDVFHSRFARHPHWNPRAVAELPAFEEDLNRLEHLYGSDPNFIDRAAHILLVGECEQIQINAENAA